MAQTPKSAAFPPLKSLVKYTSRSSGLEKTLRLTQAISQVIGATTADKTLATQCMTVRDQLALTRRYFRLLDFYGCFERVYFLINTPSSTGTILSVMEVAQYTFLGLYLLLEDLTILHDMGVARVDWYHPLMTEANKFWFYALALSIIRCAWELFFPSAPAMPSKASSAPSSREKAGNRAQQLQSRTPKWPLVKRIIIDGCDLTLPGSFLGWTPVTPLQIGLGMVLSTVLAGHDVWIAQQ
ncbi:peroxisomal biogenesis factor 11 [Aspergillus desertorum]